jgi:hypothetical protein
VGRLVFTPQERDGKEGFYVFEGEQTVTPLITGATAAQGVWWPQRDSRRPPESARIPVSYGPRVRQ